MKSHMDTTNGLFLYLHPTNELEGDPEADSACWAL